MISLLEWYGTFSRPDSSGVRKGLNRPASKRDKMFPFDRDTTYGTPQAYDRGSNTGRDAGPHEIVPKDIRHSHWEEEMDEVVGSPILIGKSGNPGSAGTVPGTGGAWADSPFDREIDDDELSAAADDEKVVSSMPIGGHQYGAGSQKKQFTGREGIDVWDRLKEAYISLKSTPEGQTMLSQGVEEAELECLMREFQKESDETLQHLEGLDEKEMVKFLMDLDPDHAADSFKELGKDRLIGTYRSWADAIGNMPNDPEGTGQ